MKDNVVVAVKPRPELEPFFKLNYEEFVRQNQHEEDDALTPPRLHQKHGAFVVSVTFVAARASRSSSFNSVRVDSALMVTRSKRLTKAGFGFIATILFSPFMSI